MPQKKIVYLSTNYRPHALHNGAPSSSLRHSGVVVVEQFEHTS